MIHIRMNEKSREGILVLHGIVRIITTFVKMKNIPRSSTNTDLVALSDPTSPVAYHLQFMESAKIYLENT